jgi:hypothetical protein
LNVLVSFHSCHSSSHRNLVIERWIRSAWTYGVMKSISHWNRSFNLIMAKPWPLSFSTF